VRKLRKDADRWDCTHGNEDSSPRQPQLLRAATRFDVRDLAWLNRHAPRFAAIVYAPARLDAPATA